MTPTPVEDAQMLVRFSREMIANATDKITSTIDKIADIRADIIALIADLEVYEALRAKHQAVLDAAIEQQEEAKP